MEATTTSTNAANPQPETNKRTVVFDYIKPDQRDENRPRGGRGGSRPQRNFEDREDRPRRGGQRGRRGGYDREANNEIRHNVQSSDEVYNARPLSYQNREDGQAPYRGRGGDRGGRGRGGRGRDGVRNWETARPVRQNKNELAEDEEEFLLTQE